MLSANPSARPPRKWTVAEDQKLRAEVEAQMSEGEVRDWCRIAHQLPGRTNKDCRKRWHNSVTGGLKKGQWSRIEDIQLAKGVRHYGQRWTLVANMVSTRSADQCAKRWQQSLDPDLDRSEWRDHEDKVLVQAVQHLGRHWKDIQRHHFPGRSKNCIKNRYTVLLRRFQNQGVPLVQSESPRDSVLSLPEVPSYALVDDEVNMSYASSMYDDYMLTPHTQPSTPETRSSWPADDESFTTWSSQEAFNVTAVSQELSHLGQHLPLSTANSPSWSMPMTSAGVPWITVESTQIYARDPSPTMLSPYASHAASQTIYGPTSPGLGSQDSSASSLSPSMRLSNPPMLSIPAPYHNSQSMTHSIRYRQQSDQLYQPQ